MSRSYFPGLGQAVADRTINRPGEEWKDVASRVAHGNALLGPDFMRDFHALHHHIDQASILMSGRHLQHGDEDQPSRPMEVFTNCSTSIVRFLTFQLLLSGSGVGSCYDDDLMVVDWSNDMPKVVVTLDPSHKDIENGVIGKNEYPTLADAIYSADLMGEHYEVFHVPDTREGWAKAIEMIELATFEKRNEEWLILDFSLVREKNRPIKGMQNRPASGPKPLMDAIQNVATLRDCGFAPWKAAIYADHYLAECVLVGGARRAARIAIKHWKDASIFEFINIKRPDEFEGLSREEVEALRATGQQFWSKLWSSNNSVAVDKEFWQALEDGDDHAWAVWTAVMDAQYGDGTGEPGFLNVDKLTQKNEGLEQYRDGHFARSKLYSPEAGTETMLGQLANKVLDHHYQYIVNPCGEIVLFILGGFCVIADVVPFFARDDMDAEDAVRTAARALMRVNLMDSIYNKEVKRTNRIGVGLTGLHEYMWARFGLDFRSAIRPNSLGHEIEPGLLAPNAHAMPFWNMIKHLSDAIEDEVRSYAEELGVEVPHTWMTMKPSGTISKLFGLTEAAHLPAMREYLRWVQFRSDDPLVQDYKAKGYPTKELVTYSGTTIVGFPTAPVITQLGMGDLLVTADEATPEEQFRWLRLLEHYWLGKNGANQISYTLKYRPSEVNYDTFEEIMLENVKNVRAVSVLPKLEVLSYEYQPEEPVSKEAFLAILRGIKDPSLEQGVDRAHVECDTGGCPIDFKDAA